MTVLLGATTAATVPLMCCSSNLQSVKPLSRSVLTHLLQSRTDGRGPGAWRSMTGHMAHLTLAGGVQVTGSSMGSLCWLGRPARRIPSTVSASGIPRPSSHLKR